MGKQLTIDHAIERAMKKTDPNARDALERVGELVRDQVAAWAGDGPRGSVGARDLAEGESE
jgi:ribosomal protein S9